MSFSKKYYIVWLLIYSFICASILHTSPSFDGAMNLLPAKNLVLFGNYYSYFFEEYFIQPIQTRATLQLPAILFMWIGGVSYFTALIPSALYTFFYIFFTEKLVRKISGKFNYYILPLFLCIPLFFYIGLRGWGEVITYFFIVSALIYWYKILEYDTKNNIPYILFGVFIGLALVTKTVALITLPAFLGALFFQFLIERKIRRQYIVSIISIFIPILLYELVRIGLMGIDDYTSWWNSQSQQIAHQAGVSTNTNNQVVEKGFFQRISTFFSTFILHIKITASHARIPSVLLIFYFLIPVVSTLIYIKKPSVKKPDRIILSFMVLLIIGYLAWWLFISPTYKVADVGKFRRILPAFLMNTFLIAFFLQENFKIRNKFSLKSISTWIILLICVFSGLNNSHRLLEIIWPDKTQIVDTSKIKTLNELPEEANIYGMSFRQNPQIAFLYKKYFHDIWKHELDSIAKHPHSYLLRDRYSSEQETLSELLDIFKHDTIIHLDTMFLNPFEVFKLNGLKEDINKIDAIELETCLQGEQIRNYPHTLGKIPIDSIAYEKNKGWNWATPRFGALMAEGNYSLLKLKLMYSPINKYKSKNKKLTIYYNDNDIGSFDLWKGINELNIPIPTSLQNIEGDEELFIDLNTELSGSSSKYYGVIINAVCLVDIPLDTINFEVETFRVNAKKRLWIDFKKPSNDLKELKIYAGGHFVPLNIADNDTVLFGMSEQLQEAKEFTIFFVNEADNYKSRTYNLLYDKDSNTISLKR